MHLRVRSFGDRRQWLRLHPDVVDVEGAWGGAQLASSGLHRDAGVYHLLQDIEMLKRAGSSTEGIGAIAAEDDVMGVNVQEVMVVGPGLASLMARVHGLLVQFPDNAVLQVGRAGCTRWPYASVPSSAFDFVANGSVR